MSLTNVGALIIPGVLSNRNPALEVPYPLRWAAGSTGAPFATDACMFCAAGIDCFICGPGDLGEAHRANESIGWRAFECGPQNILSVTRKICS
jgi:acetylornithine deacetylase/succinyl-diaminopimelate desuccinylase-like protein